jgi:hypothetical protein
MGFYLITTNGFAEVRHNKNASLEYKGKILWIYNTFFMFQQVKLLKGRKKVTL